MELIKGMLVKQFEDNRSHFIERLEERYSIKINDDEYEEYSKCFKGVFTRTGNKSIGYIIIDEITVWCLYNKDKKLLTTAYPKEIEFDGWQLIKACFSYPVRPMAFFAYQTYLDEKEKIRKEFENIKDAAIYYFTNCLFPTLHIDEYKYGSVKLPRIMNQISKLINNDSKYIGFKIEKKKVAQVKK